MDIFSNMLNPWQWALLLAVPPAIIALYFLKLRRHPLEVPSTFLWQRAIEDLHVNSLWQRLKQNLLLFLQLLLVSLLILACLRPSWRGTTLIGDRFIFLVDTSASMSANDVQPTRLEAAKEQIEALITQMTSGDAAMIISFSDRAKVEQPFTTNHGQLQRKLQAIRQNQRGSDISEALTVAAGLANPGRTSNAEDETDVSAADALPATVYVFSDGGFKSVPEFSWGNLQPEYIPLGAPETGNVAITALGVSRNPLKGDKMQTFVRVENFGAEPAEVELSLKLDGTLLDASQVVIEPDSSGGTEFEFDDVETGELEVEIETDDALRLDNTGYVGINPPQRAQVLFVTPGNEAMELALSTEDVSRLSVVDQAGPQHLETDTYRQAANDGKYELIIYDQCFPKEMPKANTLFVGRIPPTDDWSAEAEEPNPQILDVDVAHPLMKYLNFGNVQLIASGSTIRGPAGQHVLMESDIGPLGVIAPRDGFEDIVFGFEVVGADENGNAVGKTDWPFRLSFPLFFRNLIEYVGGMTDVGSSIALQPGQAVMLRRPDAVESIFVTDPTNQSSEITRSPEGSYLFNATDQVGIYRVRSGKSDEIDERFAVNLFDTVESDLRPKPMIETAWNKVEAKQGWETTRREAWRWILLIALLVLLFEWYIYNRRVFV